MTTIPGVATIHERSVWEEPGYRMALDFTRTPPAYKPGNVDLGVAHYSSARNLPDGDPGEKITDIVAWLRRSQRDYLENRTGGGYTRKSDGRVFPGYPIGYSFAVDWLGGVWVIRGFDFLPAATNQHNGHTLPVIFITDGADPATELAWQSARAIWRETRRRSGRDDFRNRPLGHDECRQVYGYGTETACCGAGLYAQLHAGLGDLDHDDHSEDDDMIIEDPPRRLLDTRQLGGTVAAGQVVTVDTGETGSGVAVNITVTETEGPGYLTAWGAGSKPATSNVNWVNPGWTVANSANVPLDGTRIRFTVNAACHVIVDLQGVHR